MTTTESVKSILDVLSFGTIGGLCGWLIAVTQRQINLLKARTNWIPIGLTCAGKITIAITQTVPECSEETKQEMRSCDA